MSQKNEIKVTMEMKEDLPHKVLLVGKKEMEGGGGKEVEEKNGSVIYHD